MPTWWSVLPLAAVVAVASASPLLKSEGPRAAFPSPLHRLVVPPEAAPLQLGDAGKDARRVGRPAGIDQTEPHHWRRPKAPAPRAAVRADPDPYRLPTHTVPTFYYLFLSVDLNNKMFMGKVEIRVNVLENTNTIVLHAAENLELSGDALVERYGAPEGETVDTYTVTVTRDLEHQTVTLTLDKELVAGLHYKITFPEFTSLLLKTLSGFYLSSYSQDGKERLLATTQFEPTHAREAFPCFDEPSFKARFQVDIGAEAKFTVRANMPAAEEPQRLRADDGDDVDATVTRFMTTVPMSTYLLAWVVSDFSSTSNADGSFTTWARPDIISGSDISQDVGPKALAALAEYTGIPFVLPKTDQFAIPDFSAGAMENWGLVTYKEAYLIRTEATDVRYEEQIASVICHELGHQWTGNLVTLDWWSHTWLNEGFATFFENFICDKVDPTLKLEDKAITVYAESALRSDLSVSQHAMSSDVSTYDQIEAKFDRISYAKGGTVLRMFQHILTPAVFQAGVQRYLATSQFNNTSPDLLFRAFSAEVALANKANPNTVLLPDNVDFTTVAQSWTEQAGAPLVRVVRDYANKKVTLTQEQLRLAASAAPKDAAGKWYIPVTLVTSKAASVSEATTVVWLTPDKTSVTLDVDVEDDEHQWLLVNPEQTGYYRVLYDDKNFLLLTMALVNPADYQGAALSASAASRAQLLNDATALMELNLVPWGITPCSLMNVVAGETEASVWLAAHSLISMLSDLLAHTDVWPSFQILIMSASEKAYESVGLTVKADDDHNTRYLRYYAVPYACANGNEVCLKDAAAALQAWIADPVTNKLHVDVARATVCYGVKGSDEATFLKVKTLWSQAAGSTRSQYARALLCTNDQTLVTGLLDEILAPSTSDEKALNDVDTVLDELTRSKPEHHRLFVDYVKSNWQKIDSFFEGAQLTSKLASLIVDIINAIRSDDEFQEISAWVKATFQKNDYFEDMTAALAIMDKSLGAWFRKEYNDVAFNIYTFTGTTPPTPTVPTAAPTSSTTPSSSTNPTSSTTPSSTGNPTSSTTPSSSPTRAPTPPPTTPSSGTLNAASLATVLAVTWAAFWCR